MNTDSVNLRRVKVPVSAATAFSNHVKQCADCKSGVLCATGKKFIAQMGDGDGDEMQITASAAASEIEALDGVLPANLQWMPPGIQVVQPLGFDEPFEINVTPAIASAADRQLQNLIAKAKSGSDVEPYGDFNHKDEGRAFKVKRFFWGGSDPKEGGVRMEVDWLPAGAKAVLDGALCCISPQWLLSKTSKQFLGITHNVGGLVPRSAFHSIQAFAKADSSKPKTQTKKMTTEDKNEIAKMITDAIIANQTTLEAKAKSESAVTAQAGADNKVIELFKTQLTDALKPVTEKLTQFETREKEGRLVQAKAVVQKHVERGAIAPEEKLPSGKLAVDYWAEQYLASAADAETQMTRLPGKNLTRVIRSNGSTETLTAGADPAQIFLAKAKAATKENKDIKTDADAIAAFAATAEGRELYEQVRSSYARK